MSAPVAMSVNMAVIRVAKMLSTTPAELTMHHRSPDATAMRDAAYWVLRARGYSLSAIGRALNRDHTTILAACRRVDRQLAVDPERRAYIDTLVIALSPELPPLEPQLANAYEAGRRSERERCRRALEGALSVLHAALREIDT